MTGNPDNSIQNLGEIFISTSGYDKLQSYKAQFLTVPPSISLKV